MARRKISVLAGMFLFTSGASRLKPPVHADDLQFECRGLAVDRFAFPSVTPGS
jgi:hypothetical protein